MRKVLVPIDGSECSLRAVQYLLDAAAGGRRPDIHLVNVQVRLPTEVGQFVSSENIHDFQHEQSGDALRPAAERLAAAGIPFTAHEEVGSTAERIAALATALGCDHIVMGTHGRSALTEFLVGSTTLKVLHEAKVPVVLVK
jgi:nucleotide-binding universal stress UspA family protein